MPPTWSRRVSARLMQAEACEHDLHIRDDLRIARLTVTYAASGEAVACAPHVLASYMVLGLHPEKVWPAIEARRTALRGRGEISVAATVPKKPPQSVKLWSDKTNAAKKLVASRGAIQVDSQRLTISVPMAAPSIAALYPNSEAPSSAKKRAYTLAEMTLLIAYSGAPHAVRAATLAALRARGPWPNQDGPATTIIQVSLTGMMIEGNCCRSTAQRRIKRACALGFWSRTRQANSWNDCPSCSAPRTSRLCAKCGRKGSRKNKGEYSPTFTYEFDVQKFIGARRCREIHSADWRSYKEFKAVGKVTEMPSRKPAQPETKPPAPAAPAPIQQPAAEHAHRNTTRMEPPPQPKLTKREAAKFVADMAELMRGHTRHTESVGGYGYDLDPSDPRYRPKMTWREAVAAVCERWKRTEESVVDSLKFYGYRLQE